MAVVDAALLMFRDPQYIKSVREEIIHAIIAQVRQRGQIKFTYDYCRDLDDADDRPSCADMMRDICLLLDGYQVPEIPVRHTFMGDLRAACENNGMDTVPDHTVRDTIWVFTKGQDCRECDGHGRVRVPMLLSAFNPLTYEDISKTQCMSAEVKICAACDGYGYRKSGSPVYNRPAESTPAGTAPSGTSLSSAGPGCKQQILPA